MYNVSKSIGKGGHIMVSKKLYVCTDVLAACAGCGVPSSLQPLSFYEIHCDIVFSGKHLFA